jgi:hypothetical protein
VRLLKLSDNEVWDIAQSIGRWRVDTSPSVVKYASQHLSPHGSLTTQEPQLGLGGCGYCRHPTLPPRNTITTSHGRLCPTSGMNSRRPSCVPCINQNLASTKDSPNVSTPGNFDTAFLPSASRAHALQATLSSTSQTSHWMLCLSFMIVGYFSAACFAAR